MNTILVCGGRDFGVPKRGMSYQEIQMKLWERMYVMSCLSWVHKNEIPIHKLISGAQTGVDSIALDWAKENNIPRKPYPAQWTKFGKPAGALRNLEMLEKEDVTLVVAFPGNDGTNDMCKKAKSCLVSIRYFIPGETHGQEISQEKA